MNYLCSQVMKGVRLEFHNKVSVVQNTSLQLSIICFCDDGLILYVESLQICYEQERKIIYKSLLLNYEVLSF